MIGQISKGQVGVIDEELVVRVAGLVAVREIAVDDFEFAHSDIHRRPVILLFDLLAGLFHSLCFGFFGRRRMNIADVDRVDDGVVDLDPGYLRRILEQSVARQVPAAHIDVDLPDLGIERAQRDVRDRVGRARAGERLFKEVCMAVDSGVASIEDHEVTVKARRVVVFSRVYVADVISGEIEIRQMQRRTHSVLNIDHVAVIDSEAVDLERVHSFECVLPSLLPQRNLALFFLDQLRLIDMDLWA